MRTCRGCSGENFLNLRFGPFRKKGWGSFKNGELLRRAEGNFDVLLTADRRMQYQQRLTSFRIGVVVIVTPRLQLRVLERALEQVTIAIRTVKAGEVLHVTIAA